MHHPRKDCGMNDIEMCLERENHAYHIFPFKNFHLSANVICKVNVFQNTPRADIRRYKSINSRWITTKEGIVISSLTWYFFIDKTQKFNFTGKDSSLSLVFSRFTFIMSAQFNTEYIDDFILPKKPTIFFTNYES